MSEKRISIVEVNSPCKDCTCADCAEEVCKFGTTRDWFYTLPTREQAIKQMTDAIFKEIAPCLKPFYKVPKAKRGCVKDAAEAALCALLEANAYK